MTPPEATLAELKARREKAWKEWQRVKAGHTVLVAHLLVAQAEMKKAWDELLQADADFSEALKQ